MELLVSVTLLGLMMALLLGGLRLGPRAWEAGTESLEQTAEIQLVQGFLRRYLSGASILDDDGDELSFEGEPDRLAFVALMPAHLGTPGLYRITLAGDENDDGIRLLLSRRLLDREETETEPEAAEETVLLEGLAGFRFGYFASAEEAAPADWRGRWEGRAALPYLVHIAVAFPEGDDRKWPDLVVAPMPRN